MRLSRLALAALPLALAACPKRVPEGEGGGPAQKHVGAAQAKQAEDELEQMKTGAGSLAPADAAAQFEAFAQKWGDAPASGEALYEAGVRWRQAKQPQRAAKALSDMLSRFPLSPHASDAKYQLGLAQIETGRGRDALQTLGTLYDKMSPGEKLDAAKNAASAAEQSGQWSDAVRWHAEAATQSQGVPDKQAEVDRAVAIIDAKLPFLDAARLRAELPPDSPAMPALVMKLARIYVHLHDFSNAEASAQEELQRWPDGPWSGDARALLDLLQKRKNVNPVAVGLAIPQSGKYKAWGDAILQGVTLALGEGSGVKLVVRDTRGEPDGAAQAIEDLVLEDNVVAIVGGVTSPEAVRAATAAQELEVPFVSLSKDEGVPEVGPFVFRQMLTGKEQARALSAWAFGHGMQRFAVMYPNVPYGAELANAFWDDVEARKGVMAAAEVYEGDRTTFAPLVKEMVGKLFLDEREDYKAIEKDIVEKEKDPFRRRKAIEKAKQLLPPLVDFDALFIPDFAKNLALITPALAVEDVVTTTCDDKELDRIKKATGRDDLKPVQLLGGNGWDDPSLVEKAQKYVECAIFVDGFYAGSDRPETRRFVEAFTKKFERPPSILEAAAFDATKAVRTVIDKQKPQTRDAMRQDLVGLKGVRGAEGELGWDASREPVRALFYLTVQKDLTLRELTPREIAPAGAGGP